MARPRKKKETTVEKKVSEQNGYQEIEKQERTIASVSNTEDWQKTLTDATCELENKEFVSETDVPQPQESVEPQSKPQPQQKIKPQELPKEEDIEVKYNVSENDTREMLDFVGITSIPKFQKSAVWVKAIAKVLKIDTSVSWVVLKRTGAKTHNIEKIFGHCAAIKKVGTPIPIEVIPYNYSAAFPQNSTYEMAKFIANYSELTVDELQHKTYEELTDMMLDIQIQMYYEDLRKNGTVE